VGWEGGAIEIPLHCDDIQTLGTPLIEVVMLMGLGTGEKEEIEMRGKRSMKIYEEIIMNKMRALDVGEEYKLSEKKAEMIAKPYLKWV
jgi:hypothetical protein